jgi:cytochrome c oxidase cbb3-type subunit 3
MRRTGLRGAVPAAAAALVLLLGACEWMPGRPDPAERPLPPSEVRSFTALYGLHCAGCHGANGRPGAARPLDDPLYLALVSDAVLRRVTAEGIADTLMPAFAERAGGTLSDAQVDVLVAGMRRWGESRSPVPAALPPYSGAEAAAAGSGPGDPERGARVIERACSRCHGPGGAGGSKAGSIVDPAFLALVSDQALRSAVIAGRPDLGMPDWRQGASGQALSDQEISDVVAWLAAKRPPAPSADPAPHVSLRGAPRTAARGRDRDGRR